MILKETGKQMMVWYTNIYKKFFLTSQTKELLQINALVNVVVTIQIKIHIRKIGKVQIGTK